MAQLQNQKQIRIGERFDSFNEFSEVLDRYELDNFVNFSIVKSHLDRAHAHLKYKFVRFNCVFFGEYEKKGHDRKTSTHKCGCQSYIYMTQKEEGNRLFLVITGFYGEQQS